jgi:hypothetical protein
MPPFHPSIGCQGGTAGIHRSVTTGRCLSTRQLLSARIGGSPGTEDRAALSPRGLAAARPPHGARYAGCD